MANITVTIPEPTALDLTRIDIRLVNGVAILCIANFDTDNALNGIIEVDIANIPSDVSDAFTTFVGHVVSEFKTANGL